MVGETVGDVHGDSVGETVGDSVGESVGGAVGKTVCFVVADTLSSGFTELPFPTAKNNPPSGMATQASTARLPIIN